MVKLKKELEIPSNKILYKSENLIVYRVKEAVDLYGEVAIIGDGCSFSLDSQNRVTFSDFGLRLYTERDLRSIRKEVLMIYYPFECEGLRQSGEELADFMNQFIFNVYHRSKIQMFGHSKSGVSFGELSGDLQDSIQITTVSAPFHGTILTMPEEFEKGLFWFEKMIYREFYSGHQVDKDIAIGSQFLKKADFSGLKFHQFYNIICLLTKPESLGGLGCYYLKKRKHQDGDGVVTKNSQILSGIDGIDCFMPTKSHADFWNIIYPYLL